MEAEGLEIFVRYLYNSCTCTSAWGLRIFVLVNHECSSNQPEILTGIFTVIGTIQ